MQVGIDLEEYKKDPDPELPGKGGTASGLAQTGFLRGVTDGISSSFSGGLLQGQGSGLSYDLGKVVGDGLSFMMGAGTATGGGAAAVGGIATGPGELVLAPAGAAAVTAGAAISTNGVVQGVKDIATLMSGNSGLPSSNVVNQDGVRVTHNYNGGDHGPAHLHVEGEGPATRIGQNGKPLRNNPELSSSQRQVVQENRSVIRKTVDQIMKWYRNN